MHLNSNAGSCASLDARDPFKFKNSLVGWKDDASWWGTLPGIANDEAAEHGSDTGSRASNTHCGSSSTNELGGSVDVSWDCAGLEGARQDRRLADWQQGLRGRTFGDTRWPFTMRIHKICAVCVQMYPLVHLDWIFKKTNKWEHIKITTFSRL